MMGEGTLFVRDARLAVTRPFEPGFSLLELVVVIVIISILVGVALNRLLPYIDEAERVGVLTLGGQHLRTRWQQSDAADARDAAELCR